MANDNNFGEKRLVDDKVFATDLAEWVDGWRESRGISSDGKLNPAQLDMFVSDLQTEIINRIPDFTLNNVDPNASLVLYSGADYAAVKSMCANSGGKYYMISQTQANALWNKDFQKSVKDAIGDDDLADPTTLRVLSGKSIDNSGNLSRIDQYATDSHNLLAMDDFLSYKLAEAGAKKGNVIYIVGDRLSDTSVGMLTEIPEVFRETLANGDDISGKLQLATNLRMNKAGGYEFDLIDPSEAKIYLTENGDVKLVDFKETIGLSSSNVGEYSLTGKFKDYATLTHGRTAEELADAFKMSQILVGSDGNIVGHSFDNVIFKDGTKLTEYMTPAPVKGEYILKLDSDTYNNIISEHGKDALKNAIDDATVSVNKKGDIVNYDYKGTILEDVVRSDTIYDNHEVIQRVKHSELKRLYEASSGDKTGAIKVFDRVGKDADIASAVLNKSKGNAIKALESIDEAQRTALVYLNDDGVEIGQSYKDTALESILPDKIPSDYKYSIRRSDLALLPPEASVSGKFPMYDKLSPADKIQIRDIERRRATGEISDKAEVVIGIDNNGRSKVSLNVNGKVVPGALEPGTICIAMDMEGEKSVVCRDLEDAKWKNQIEDLISDVKVKMINGVDRNQFRSVADALKKRGVTNPSKVIADAIGKIPSDNTDGMRFVTDIATGRNSISKILNFNIGDYEKTGEGIDVIKRWISHLDERNVPAKTVSERDVKNILTSLNMEIENSLSIKERQKALARATHKNIPVYALMGKGKRKGFTIEQISVLKSIVGPNNVNTIPTQGNEGLYTVEVYGDSAYQRLISPNLNISSIGSGEKSIKGKDFLAILSVNPFERTMTVEKDGGFIIISGNPAEKDARPTNEVYDELDRRVKTTYSKWVDSVKQHKDPSEINRNRVEYRKAVAEKDRFESALSEQLSNQLKEEKTTQKIEEKEKEYRTEREKYAVAGDAENFSKVIVQGIEELSVTIVACALVTEKGMVQTVDQSSKDHIRLNCESIIMAQNGRMGDAKAHLETTVGKDIDRSITVDTKSVGNLEVFR